MKKLLNPAYFFMLCIYLFGLSFSLDAATLESELQIVENDKSENEIIYLPYDPKQCLIIIETDIDPLKIKTNNIFYDLQHPEPGLYKYYVKKYTHQLTIWADNFKPVHFEIYLEEGQTKYIKVTEKKIGIGTSLNSGVGKVFLKSGEIFVVEPDGSYFSTFVPRSSGPKGELIFKKPPGKHEILLVRKRKNGKVDYAVFRLNLNISDTVTVNPLFGDASGKGVGDFAQSSNLTVYSEPSGARVYLNGVKAGETPFQTSSISVGSHKIRLEKLLYKPYETTVTISSSGSNKVNYNLKPDFGELILKTNPSGANVYIDNKPKGLTPFIESMLPSGTHHITLSYDKYHDIVKTFNLYPEDKIDETYQFKSKFGRLVINSEPFGSEVYLEDEFIGKTPLTLDTVTSSIYPLRITKEFYASYEKHIEIKDDQTTTINDDLNQDYGVIKINSIPENISVSFASTKQIIGRTPLTRNLKPGSYTILLENDRYETYTESLFLKNFDTLNLNFTLKPKLGQMHIVSKPSDAEIFINNKSVGRSPLKMDYPIGVYDVRIEKDRYYSNPQQIDLKYNANEKISFELDKESAVNFIVSNANARIYLNDKYFTYDELKSIKPGYYNFKIIADKFRTEEFSQNIPPGFIFEKHIKLKPSGGIVTLKTNPSFAQITLNGKQTVANQTVELDKGKYDYIASAQGYKTKKGSFKVNDGDTTTYNFGLKKIKPVIPGGEYKVFSGYKNTKEYLNGVHVYLGYSNFKFNNEVIKKNIADGIISEGPGLLIGLQMTYLPFVIDAHYMLHDYDFSDSLKTELDGRDGAKHNAGRLALMIAPLPFSTIFVPYAGGGYQYSRLETDSTSTATKIVLSTSSYFLCVGVNIHIPISKDKRAINRLILQSAYRRSIGKDKEWDQLSISLGVSLDLLKKQED